MKAPFYVPAVPCCGECGAKMIALRGDDQAPRFLPLRRSEDGSTHIVVYCDASYCSQHRVEFRIPFAPLPFEGATEMTN